MPFLTLPELLEAATCRGFPAVGLWRDHFDDYAVDDVARLLADSGLRVSSLCRAGLFTHEDAVRRRRAVQDSLRAVDQAAAIGAATLVVVPGGLVGRDLAGSRAMVRDGLGQCADYAARHGVTLALEPMHPMLVEARSCITTTREALDLLDELGPGSAGIALDSYHVWWDSGLERLLERLSGRVLSVQVADWVEPGQGLTTSRGLPGEGCIDLGAFLALAARSGFTGDVEVEVLSEHWWEQGGRRTLDALGPALQRLDRRCPAARTG